MIRHTLALLLLSASSLLAADWPQWRGPERSNVSKDRGLLNEWPKEGPPLAWKAAGLGDGVSPVSVAGGRVFTTGNVGEDVVCTALSERDGKPLWATKIGPAAKESSLMRWLAQTRLTVDRERLYTVTANGDYACLAVDTGKVIWSKHFVKDFAGKKITWGFCDYPLVDGDKLVICPGGDKNSVAALNKTTGDALWGCSIAGEFAAHSVLIAAELDGIKQYVVHLGKGLYGISTKGRLLWKYEALSNRTANTHAPIARQGEVFFANGYGGAGHALLNIRKKDDAWLADEVYRDQDRLPYVPWLGSPTTIGDQIVINTNSGLNCLDWNTGKLVWEEKTLRRCMYTIADGKLFIRSQSGKVGLAEADPKAFKLLAEFTPPQLNSKAPAWTFPVVANGRLYVRDYDTLLSYDVRDPDRPKKKVPDAVFVPTPADVVTNMLELAAVKKGDIVYDLGSGDGRIVIAAAKAFGCKAIGVELDKDLIAKSRERAKEAGIEKLATFEQGDLFDADFSSATVVAIYILPSMSRKLIPKFEKLEAGTRIVSHCFAIPGIVPDRVVKVTSDDDDVERPIYLYSVPLNHKKAGEQ